MKLAVLGTGCAKCNALEASARAAAEKLGLDFELVKVSDLAKIASYGVIVTPALVVDGAVKSSGRLLSPDEIAAMLKAL